MVAALTNADTSLMLPSWLSMFTVSKSGSGFQIPGVFGLCCGAAHVISPLAQSGCVPFFT